MVDCFSARECKCIRQYVEKNKETHFKKWLIPETENDDMLTGTQGSCGIVKLSEKPDFKLVYKISLKEDFVIENEYNILKTLEEIKYCIHVPQVYSLLKIRTPLIMDRATDSLFKSAEKSVTRKVLLQQYIKHIGSLYDMIVNPHFSDAEVVSIIQQVLMTIQLFQTMRLTHYDLHASNVLVSMCEPGTGILYRVDEHTFFLVNSHGHIAKVIDFGFSFCEKNAHKELNCTLKHTEKGFLCHQYDHFADLKLFMISIINDLKTGRRKEMMHKVRRICQNVFKRIHVDWDNGWDISTLPTPVEVLADNVPPSLELFREDDTWVDTLQHLIDTPLSPFKHDDIQETFALFAQEFVKIEERIGDIKLLNLCFKQIIIYSKKYRSSFFRGGEEQQWAIQQFRDGMVQYFDKVAAFFNADVDYAQLLSTVLNLANEVEGLYYKELQKRDNEKKVQHDRIRVNHVNDAKDMFKIIRKLVSKTSNRRYDNVYVVDSVLRQTKWLDLKQLWAKSPSVTEEQLGKFIYNYYLSSTIKPETASQPC